MPRIRGANQESSSRGNRSSCCTLFFFFTSLVELVIILHLIGTKTLHVTESLHGNEHNELTSMKTRPSSVTTAVEVVELLAVNPTVSPTCSSVSVITAPPALEGVAVTLFLHSPTWFQRRNSIMVNLVRGNLPPGWKVQIFWMGHGQSKNAIDINPGVKRLIDNGDVILTLIPDEILEKKQKKKMIHLMTEEWIWQNMAAPKVLLFGGNNVICTNSPYRITDFSHWDYIGAPWNTFHGMGGEGAISIRSRDAMLSAIKYAKSKLPPAEVPNAYLKWIPDDHFFVKTMLEMNKNKLANFKIADRNATLTFAGKASLHPLSHSIYPLTPHPLSPYTPFRLLHHSYR